MIDRNGGMHGLGGRLYDARVMEGKWNKNVDGG